MHGLWEALRILRIYRPIFFLDREEQINYNKQLIQHDVVCSFPECENNQKFMNKSINYFNKSNYMNSTIYYSNYSSLQRQDLHKWNTCFFSLQAISPESAKFKIYLLFQWNYS